MTRRRRRRWLPAAMLMVAWHAAGCGPGRDTSAPPPGVDLAAAFHHNNLGVALMDHGGYSEAAAEFREALGIWEGYVPGRVNLGIALYYEKQYDSARDELQAALRDSAGDLRAHYMLGLHAYYNTAQHDEAARHFEVVAKADPDDVWNQFYLGLSLLKDGRFLESADALSHAVQLDRGHLAARYHLSLALRRLGREAEATAALAEFTRLRSSASAASATPGVGYMEQGPKAEAAAESRAPARTIPSFVSVTGDVDGIETRALEQGLDSVAGDYDNDGLQDELRLRDGMIALYRRDAGGALTDVTAGADLSVEQGSRCTAAAFADVDHDGDLDIYVCRDGRPNLLFRNTGTGGFVEIGRQAGVDGDGARGMGVVFSDLDNDRAVDFCVVSLDAPPSLFYNNRDGTFTERSAAAGMRSSKGGGGVCAGDVNGDGYTDLFFSSAESGGGDLFLSDRGRSFRDAGLIPGTAEAREPGGASGFLDFDRDGDLDLISAPSGGSGSGSGVRLMRNELLSSRGSHWLTVRAQGRIKPQVLSNFSGIGTKVEVRAAGLWLKREVQASTGDPASQDGELTFGLGEVEALDYVRAVFPSGVRLTLRNVKADQTIVMEEPAGKYTSCPMVYAWNGQRFAFVGDTLGAAVLGEWEGPGRWLHPDRDEWLKINARQLASRGGAMLVRVVNQLEEVDYLDSLRLVALDHPADVEVFPDERVGSLPAPPRAADRAGRPAIFSVRGARHLVAAMDDHGHDVREILSRDDGRYVDDFDLLAWRGLASRHGLTLDLGFFNAPRPVLLLHGWTDWGSSSSLLGAWQAGVAPLPVTLEVQDSAGRWRPAIPDIGYPAGLPRTILVPLDGLFNGADHRFRITTNLTVYWDEARVAYQSGAAPRLVELPLRSAELRGLGYPRTVPSTRRTDHAHSVPPSYDYQDLSSDAEWGVIAGAYTRFGDVTELLRLLDDRFVVMGHGEEVALEFEADGLPPLAPGWARDFLLYAGGYGKDMDVNSAHPFTVVPMPFHAMTRYPYSGDELLTRDPEDLEWLLRWNTRSP